MKNLQKMTRRAWILFGMLAVGFSTIWLLPDQKQMVPSRLSKKLPDTCRLWQSVPREVSDKEKEILADDTEFARRFYFDPENPARDYHGFEVSVVFSGKDINNSLHRPEVCLVAQGWQFVGQRHIKLDGVMPDGSDLPVKELVCVRPRIGEDKQPVMNGKGEPMYDKRIQFYTYIGRDKVVSDHYQRTWEDIKDRIVGGFDQQWAYATFSTAVTSAYVDQGNWNSLIPSRDEDQTREALSDFIQQLLPLILDQES
ncbi:Protein of unknown function [Rubritalea squalenifaciens DSM 18772]|uniref:Methanolan biosynthesis EpsI domain-containing protein n=1 Tax=Rubritalea squalenifaciens DSM 18772 TaxID=1123071 RepID=A0A1M6DIF2_9BACT|nr:exosortase-associated EpsI family protein [Rubritalea squalenifaciens]SHI73094.1 Protein of unknown function [Rubritalea squalenifaciens DSM 18772]